MARPIEFDRELALQSAMQLFWRQGYQKTSIRDLTAVTHLQPGSLYSAFRNKRNLFLRSLDFYTQVLHGSVDRVLRSELQPLERIHQFFSRLLDEITRDAHDKGCLLVNTLLETPAEDVELTTRVAEALSYVENSFAGVLEEAKRRGDLAPEFDSESGAKLLMTGIFGIRVYAKMRTPPEVLHGIIKALLSSLEKGHAG